MCVCAGIFLCEDSDHLCVFAEVWSKDESCQHMCGTHGHFHHIWDCGDFHNFISQVQKCLSWLTKDHGHADISHTTAYESTCIRAVHKWNTRHSPESLERTESIHLNLLTRWLTAESCLFVLISSTLHCAISAALWWCKHYCGNNTNCAQNQNKYTNMNTNWAPSQQFLVSSVGQKIFLWIWGALFFGGVNIPFLQYDLI